MTPTILPDRLNAIADWTLDRGAHSRPGAGACVMEAVAYVAGEPWSDHPECASPTIAAFMRAWNDRLDTGTRQKLKPYIPRLVGTAGTVEAEQTRRWMCADWLVHTSLPLWLRAAGLDDQAETVERLPEVVDGETWRACRSTLWATRDLCWEARRLWRPELAKKVRAAVTKRLTAVAADADAAADVDADAAADAAAAVAVAVAAAADVDVDVDAAAAAASAADGRDVYMAVYRAVRDTLAVRWRQLPAIQHANTTTQASAFDLLDRLIAVTAP